MAEGSPHLRNCLLAAIPAADFERLEPLMQEVELPTAQVLYEVDDPVETLYLPHDAVISVVSVMHDGSVAEMATIGMEGVAGFTWEPPGRARANGRHVVQLPGRGTTLPLAALQARAAESASVRRLMLFYLESCLRATMQLVACNALHPVEARCARWLLMTEDRVGSPELRLTQEFLAEMLGVQRTTVSLVARTFEREGLIRTRRGRIEVANREGLKARSCECYAIIDAAFKDLPPDCD